MPLKNIITVPDPLLKSISKPVDKINDEIKILINDMFETMYNAPGVGLAAVQVGIPLRVVVIDISKGDERKPHFFINPNIVWRSDKTSTYEEGCLSLPSHFAEVERPAECHLNFIDYNGKKKDLKASGLLATCIQHEVDHLDGILFIDHISKLKRDMIIKILIKSKKELDKVIL